jgi:hypothetical protein
VRKRKEGEMQAHFNVIKMALNVVVSYGLKRREGRGRVLTRKRRATDRTACGGSKF